LALTVARIVRLTLPPAAIVPTFVEPVQAADGVAAGARAELGTGQGGRDGVADDDRLGVRTGRRW
jgi:hypothetical protein